MFKEVSSRQTLHMYIQIFGEGESEARSLEYGSVCSASFALEDWKSELLELVFQV